MSTKQPTVQVVNEAVAEAGGIQSQTDARKMAKQAEKQRKKDEAYMNSMITRREAMDLVKGAVAPHEERERLLFIQVKTLANLLIERGMVTREELDELSLPVVGEIYGEQAVERIKKQKEEAKRQAEEAAKLAEQSAEATTDTGAPEGGN